MDELTAFLNARDNEDNNTLVDATPVTNATPTTSPVTKKENTPMENTNTLSLADIMAPLTSQVERLSTMSKDELLITVARITQDVEGILTQATVQVELLQEEVEHERSLKEKAVANFHKKCQRIKELEGMLAGRSTPQAPVTRGGTSIPRTQVPTTKGATAQLPMLGTPMGTGDCPTCQGTVKLNRSGHCITCSNNAVKAAWQARYEKKA